MGLIAGAIAAVVLGVTTVLPLSDSGHRVLFRLWLNAPEQLEATHTVVHFAVALALILALSGFSARPAAALRSPNGNKRQPAAVPEHQNPGRAGNAPGNEASSPWLERARWLLAALLGLGLHALLDGRLGAPNQVPTVAGLGLLSSALMLASLAFAPEPTRSTPGWVGACLAGIAQGIAAVPGTSPIAAAFVTLCWLGVSRWQAARLSLWICLPSWLAGAVSALRAQPLLEQITASRALLIALLAFLAATASCALFRLLCERQRNHRLLWWLVPIGLSLLLYGRVLPPSAAGQAKYPTTSHTAIATASRSLGALSLGALSLATSTRVTSPLSRPHANARPR